MPVTRRRRASVLLCLPLLAGCVTTLPAATPAPTVPSTPAPTETPIDLPTAVPTEPATDAPTDAPTEARTGVPTAAPTDAPSTGAPSPGAPLDPSESDAGVVAEITLEGDTRGDRDGTHRIVGLRDDGSYCSTSFEGDEFIFVAWYDDAPIGQLHQFGITVPADAIPEVGGETLGVDDRAYADFVSETGFGTAYYGDSSRDDQGFTTIDIRRTEDTLRFDFRGETWDAVRFSGAAACTYESF